VVKFRDDVTFHDVAPTNGRKMTAEDVRFSIQRYKDIGASKGGFEAIESMEVTDDHTLTLKLSRATASVIATLGDGTLAWILAKEAAGETEMTAQSTFVGTGPYMFEKYDTEVVMTFVKNPNFFEGDGKPYIERVETAIIPEVATYDAQFRAGQLTLISVEEQDRLEDMQQVPDVETLTYPATGMPQFEFALHVPPFNNPDVRRALSLALDRPQFPDAIGVIDWGLSSHAFPASYSPYYLDPLGPDFGENSKWFKQNLTEAKALLDAAGYGDGFEFTHNFTPQYANYQLMSELMVDQLAQVGVTVNLRSWPYTEWQQRFKVATGAEWRTWTGMQANAPATFPDPSLYFQVYWLGDDSTRGMYTFKDPELVSMYEDQDRTFDQEERIEKLRDIQRYMAFQMRALNFQSGYSATLWSKNLKNMYPRLSYGRGSETVAQVWFEEA
jgi:peptide/nickel transport system substrate-binding protein